MPLPTNYRLGVTVMDYQHGRLLDLIDQLKARSTGLGELLGGFNAYAEQHFAMEEALMEAHDYPERLAHVSEHATYRRLFAGMQTDTLTDSPLAVRAMQAFLGKWWVEHIGNVDQKLATFLKEQGMHDWA
jgi:hemerythrin